MAQESAWSRLLGPAVCVGLVLIFFGSVLFSANQLSYRDAGHYYYPLYKLVQREWSAGRWPLWEPEENSGMPLMGNPTAAVLYPGKIIYGLFPYPIAAKLYIVTHAVVAFATMTLLLRSWGLGRPAATIGSLSYAFGAPILFQYCNVIFLVGAAWLPLGFRAVDRWLRLGNRRGLLELAIVLALQTMGGDPQASYLLGLSAGAYALQLAWLGNRGGDIERSDWMAGPRAENGPRRSRAIAFWLLVLAGLAGWTVLVLVLARILPGLRPGGPPPAKPLWWMRWAPLAVGVSWLVLIAAWWSRSRDLSRRRLLATMMAGLIGAATLGGGLAAAQLMPVAEFTARTNRAAEGGPHDIYPFSLEPFVVAQFLWPNVFGTHFPENTFWVEAFDWPSFRRTIWVPSLYIGGLGVILGLSVFGFRGGPPWRAWMSGVVLFSVLASFGQYTSPLWLTRAIDTRLNPEFREAMRRGDTAALRNGYRSLFGIGPIDPIDVNPVRLDGYLRDGDGGFYWALSTFLPGFRQFRYPSKLLTFTCFGLSVLAGLGWEKLIRGDRRRAERLASGVFAITLVLLIGVYFSEDRFYRLLKGEVDGSQWGLFNTGLAYRGLLASLAQTTLLATIGLAIFRLAGRRPAIAGALAAILVSADLAVANSRLILSSPQELYENVPEALRVIREAEEKDPSDGPFRVHRMPIWSPPAWGRTSSQTRAEDYTRWERDTIQPKYGITEGVEYTQTIGVTELYDYEWFFGPFGRKAKPQIAESLGVPLNTEVVYYPRRAYDMWNSRYFIVPQFPNHWTDAGRGYASFIIGNVSLLYPEASRFRGPGGQEKLLEWTDKKDFQVFRNEDAYPRAWIVRDFRGIEGGVGMNRDNREGPMYEMLFANDPLWTDSERNVFDPRVTAWIDKDEIGELGGFRGKRARVATEKAVVTYPGPQEVRIECSLETPGMVVLSDVYYPGWKLTIDGKPAKIYRTNRLMRGAAVPAGKSTLVYTYEPESFRIGLIISAASILAVGGLAVFFAGRPLSPTIVGEDRLDAASSSRGVSA